MKKELEEKPKGKKIIEGAYDLSLGISVVVAILLGIGIGYGLMKIFHSKWFMLLGILWGTGAGILNIYKAYKKTKKELDQISQDPKYSHSEDH